MSCVSIEALELQDFVLSQSRARGIEATMPAADGNYYYQLLTVTRCVAASS